MERRELEAAAARSTYLRGLLAVPFGLLFWITGAGNLGWEPLTKPLVFLACLAVLGAAEVALTRYYNDHYGRVRLAKRQQVRFTVASALCFGIPLVGGTIADFRLDLPISLFCASFGAGMLVWFGLCVGLRKDHVLVWGSLVVLGLLPVWGGFEDRGTIAWFPIGLATIVAGVLDHRALQRSVAPGSALHVAA